MWTQSRFQPHGHHGYEINAMVYTLTYYVIFYILKLYVLCDIIELAIAMRCSMYAPNNKDMVVVVEKRPC